MDFMIISTRMTKNGVEIYPKFVIKKSSDLMIRGGDFYAVWIEALGLWSTDESDAIRLIDHELEVYAEDYRKRTGNENPKVLYLWDAETGMIDKWHKYCQQQMRDQFHMLDEKLIFSNMETSKTDYASKRLSYPLAMGDISAYDRLISVLYSPEERHKIEWAIGSIVSGDSKTLQKFLVLYGSQGTGKSTILNIIQKLFDGYYAVFDAKALGSANNRFALEPFRTNPLVAIQHDGDLSRIEDNTRLNSLVSHELMTIDEKFTKTYSSRFKCFLFMGTNKPVRITDAKSGLIRRLIDVSPTGDKIGFDEYMELVAKIDFELGAIASHCLQVYLDNPNFYDNYIPISMLGASNDFYNFVMDSYSIFKREDGVTLKMAWSLYKIYVEDAKIPYPFSQRLFKEELKNYFREYYERYTLDDGTRVRSYYKSFREDKFEETVIDNTEKRSSWLDFAEQPSILDDICKDCKAQYANSKGTPTKPWSEVTDVLADLDTSRLHYAQFPINHIIIDFDMSENGEKNLQKNIDAASKWPKTYAELSKSGAGIHLHYIYEGDVDKLSHIYDQNIEIKTFKGNSAIRRKLSKCVNLPIATLNSGLPEKGASMVNFEGLKNEKALRTLIKRNLNKEIWPNTKPSVEFIKKALDDAYNSGLAYDVRDMRNSVLSFATGSTHNAEYCVKMVAQMKFMSEVETENTESGEEAPILFYDIEIFPNLFVICYMPDEEDREPQTMINPSSADIERLLKFRLIGFNNRRYDNHLVYAALLGYTNEQLYKLSQKIILEGKGFFREAYNLSYTDIYDFASAGNKKSLKKLEIEMGTHHQELGLPWDQPVDRSLWQRVADYCKNDVIETRHAFYYLKSDWTARQILADLAEGSVNDTTNTLTAKFIFGNNRSPQNEFNYRNMSKPVYDKDLDEATHEFLKDACPDMMETLHGEMESILPYFEGYTFEKGKSTYKGFEVGEGGFVYAEPGCYGNAALLDVMSMHPHSIIAECLFGPRFTTVFKSVVDGRVSIKHKAWEELNDILDGKLTRHIQRVLDGEITHTDLANGLKTAINSVYGLTDAGFDNAFRDKRNIDNIVAKRGALFMIDLLELVKSKGYTVVHIKTDSIKIADADEEIIEEVMKFGKRYGYTFEHEATYEKICLVNNAVYIAKDARDGHWTATGAQFKEPYVFKTLFSKEGIEFHDLCQTFEVKSALYLDAGNDLQFIGRVGSFCPIKEGCGGGTLLRQATNKQGETTYAAATGTKGYYWLEAEVVDKLEKYDDIDMSYYRALVDDAWEAIKYHCDPEWFCSDEPYVRYESPIWPF